VSATSPWADLAQIIATIAFNTRAVGDRRAARPGDLRAGRAIANAGRIDIYVPARAVSSPPTSSEAAPDRTHRVLLPDVHTALTSALLGR
jgi:hypothetical protein